MASPVDVRVRDFTPDDLTAVRTLIHLTIDTCYADVYPPNALDFFKAFHEDEKIVARARDGDVLVAQAAGEILGTGATIDGTILGVFVDPAAQGRGIGKLLMAALEERASARGYKHARLSVSATSREFYAALGYARTDDHRRDLGDGQWLEFYNAEKRLAGDGRP